MTPSERTRHPSACTRCHGAGYFPVAIPPTHEGMVKLVHCDHVFTADVTGPDGDELRIAQLEDRNRLLESKLSQCAATCEEEARKVREGAIEEACSAVRRAIMDSDHAPPSLGEAADLIFDAEAAIRALKGKA